MADKILFKQTFRKGHNALLPEFLPTLKHTGGMQPHEANLMCAGKIERAGVVQEFQDLRVYFAPERMPSAEDPRVKHSPIRAKKKAVRRGK